MSATTPHVVILAGPNGAGKSTAAPRLLRGTLRVSQFVNADVIARGIAGFNVEDAALAAGRIMLERINDLAARRITFAFETTLAARTLAPWIKTVSQQGYQSHLVFLWLPNVAIAIARVRDRVSAGGHNVPEAVIKRRYTLGLRNFVRLYQPMVSTWRVYNNGQTQGPRLVAMGAMGRVDRVIETGSWTRLLQAANEPYR